MNTLVFDFMKEGAALKDVYRAGSAYGFLEETGIFPKRALDMGRLVWSENGVSIAEKKCDMIRQNENHYHYGGMAFRMVLPHPGTYRIAVTLNTKREAANVSLAGMIPEQLLSRVPWDAAGRIARNHPAYYTEEQGMPVWHYTFAAGSCHLDVEIEPAVMEDTQVGMARIVVEELLPETEEGKLPVLYLLGDSTVKSYVCEEAPMAAWGQVFARFFDDSQVKVYNYSQGGRSLKSMYQEGRLNDILLSGRPGDYIFLQSGHNDESRGEPTGIEYRFGRGNTEATYIEWLETYFLPAIYARGMHPVFVTCMTRLDNEYYTKEGDFDYDSEPVHFGGFLYGDCPHIDFPGIMKKVGEAHAVPVIDLYTESLRYLEAIGGEAAKSMFLSLEAGETPGKTNSGSYANGNPSQMCDGSHYKESLAKQFARIIVTDMCRQKLACGAYLKTEVKEAAAAECFDKVLPEIPRDIRTGRASYYRNQIEKLLLLGVMQKEEDDCFYPYKTITAIQFQGALAKVWPNANATAEEEETDGRILDRQHMAAMIYRAYTAQFGSHKLRYMTDYNGTNLTPDDPNYDSNLMGESAQYYPLVPWQLLEDKSDIDNILYDEVQAAYELGLIRAEQGIMRGRMQNGTRLEPRQAVTREKAAKALYFLWVLKQDILKEVHEL